MRNFLTCFSKLVILLVASLGAAAQERTDIATTGNGTVGGRVLCADTGKPARFAEVRLTPIRNGGNAGGLARGAGQTSTLADGSFLVDNVAPGDYVVTARTPGYIDAERLLTFSPGHATFEPPSARQIGMVTSVRVTSGQSSTTTVTIYRGAVLAGTVSYDDGSPALGVSVSALQGEVNNHGGGGAGTVTSNDRGAFRIAGLSEGNYILQARPLGSTWTKPLPVYYGNTLLKAAAKRIAVKAGDERNGLDLQVPVSNLRRVSGVVQSATGHGIGQAYVSMTLAGEGEDAMNTISLADGSFRFQSVPDGKFTLSASAAPDSIPGQGNSSRNSSSSQPQNIEVNGSDVDDVVFNLPAAAATSSGVGSRP